MNTEENSSSVESTEEPTTWNNVTDDVSLSDYLSVCRSVCLAGLFVCVRASVRTRSPTSGLPDYQTAPPFALCPPPFSLPGCHASLCGHHPSLSLAAALLFRGLHNLEPKMGPLGFADGVFRDGHRGAG